VKLNSPFARNPFVVSLSNHERPFDKLTTNGVELDNPA
jgi:hypothetical protein